MAATIWTEVKGTRRIEAGNPGFVDWILTLQGAHGSAAPLLGVSHTDAVVNYSVDTITTGGSASYLVTCAATPEIVQVSDTFRGPSNNLDRVIVRIRGFVSEG